MIIADDDDEGKEVSDGEDEEEAGHSDSEEAAEAFRLVQKLQMLLSPRFSGAIWDE